MASWTASSASNPKSSIFSLTYASNVSCFIFRTTFTWSSAILNNSRILAAFLNGTLSNSFISKTVRQQEEHSGVNIAIDRLVNAWFGRVGGIGSFSRNQWQLSKLKKRDEGGNKLGLLPSSFSLSTRTRATSQLMISPLIVPAVSKDPQRENVRAVICWCCTGILTVPYWNDEFSFYIRQL